MLYQPVLRTQEFMQHFIGETLSATVLGSGATSSICGKTWIDFYEETLSDEGRLEVTKEPSTTNFKFGDGRKVPSIEKVTIPTTIDEQSVKIRTDVVRKEIPLLLSKKPMKKAVTNIDFKADTVSMFSSQQKLIITSSRRYAVPLGQRARMDKIQKGDLKITLVAKTIDINNKMKIVKKLHSRFSHPPPKKLIKLVSNAGMNDEDLEDAISEVYEKHEICKVYCKPGFKPVVSVSLAEEFNKVVAMDLKIFESSIILHLVDHVTRFSAAAVVKSKYRNEIIKHLFRTWISIFGAPSKFFSDNGGEFNEGYNEMCDSYSILIKKTAAKSPFSNGLME